MAETKKIQINLAAFTRVEYCEVVEVPADMTRDQLDELVERRYDEVCGTKFWNDPEYWERATCGWDKITANDGEQPADVIVTRDESGELQVQEVPKAPEEPEA